MMNRNHDLIPVLVKCEIIGENKWPDDKEEIDELHVFTNGKETELCLSEEMEIRGIVWDFYTQGKDDND